MIYSRKTIVVTALLALVIITTASTVISGPAPTDYRNLKILPKDISPQKMDSIMGSYNKALKVSCDFCHIAPKDNPFSIAPKTKERKIDFALDNPMKEEARRMMRLTIDLNKTHFYFDKKIRPEYLNVVSCNTCHRGNPYPAFE